MSNTDIERALDMIGLVPNSPVDRAQTSSDIADNQEETSDLNKRKRLTNQNTEPEIQVGTRHQIPASAFKFKIPIPPQQTQ